MSLAEVFGIKLKTQWRECRCHLRCHRLSKLKSDAFRPRALYERFNIEALATTDAATDRLQQHQAIRASGWGGRIIPTFRPDAVVNIEWRKLARKNIDQSERSIGRLLSVIMPAIFARWNSGSASISRRWARRRPITRR